MYTALLEHSHTHSLTYCLWLRSHFNRRTESLQQRPYGSQNLNYLLIGPSQRKKFANPSSAQWDAGGNTRFLQAPPSSTRTGCLLTTCGLWDHPVFKHTHDSFIHPKWVPKLLRQSTRGDHSLLWAPSSPLSLLADQVNPKRPFKVHQNMVSPAEKMWKIEGEKRRHTWHIFQVLDHLRSSSLSK